MKGWAQGVAQLVYERCGRCGHRWYLPRPCCPRCADPAVERRCSAGIGTVVAVTTVHRAPTGAPHPPTPFGICLVQLAEDVRVMGRCPADVAPGDRVGVGFPDGIPYFEKEACS